MLHPDILANQMIVVSLQYKYGLAMEQKAFNAINTYKIQDLISLIIEYKHFDFGRALSWLYNSKLYIALSDEETKLWHLSSYKLFDMLENEKRTGEIVFPDFV